MMMGQSISYSHISYVVSSNPIVIQNFIELPSLAELHEGN